jgi:uncharacterized Zn finger protein
MTERAWSTPFVALLESLRMPAQFGQGRRFVRNGQIRQMTIAPSIATALVLDDGQFYRARIAVRALNAGDWSRLERAIGAEAIHAAKLLAGEVPPGLLQVAANLGLALFPDDLADLAMDCACSDPRIPCRHLTAACYALADAFDRDPFNLLTWRGRSRDELLDGLRAHHVHREPAQPRLTPTPPVADFWTAGPRLTPGPGPLADTVRRPDAILDQLDPPRLAVGRHELIDLLRPVYRAAATDD